MGGIIAAVMLTSRAISPVAKLANLMTRSNQTVSALRQLDDLMLQESEFENKAHLASKTKLQGHIVAEHLDFQYPSNQSPSLKDISLSVSAGEKLRLLVEMAQVKVPLRKCCLVYISPLLVHYVLMA